MIESFFETNYFKENVSHDFSELNFKDEILKQNNITIPILDDGGISSYEENKKYHTDDRLSSFVETLTPSLENGWKELGFRKDLFPTIRDMWCNIVYDQGNMEEQRHPTEFQMFGIYHVSAPEDSGDLIFYHPADWIFSTHAFEPNEKRTKCRVKVKTGDLILFPSYLKFSTTENKSNQDRVTLEFGCDYKFIKYHKK